MRSLITLLLSTLIFSCGDSATSTNSDVALDTASSVAITPDTKSKDAAMQTTVLKLKNGKEVNVTLATLEETEQARTIIESQGISFADCCGQEACYSGYIWSCSRGNDNKCHWYKSDWKCN